VSSFQHKESFPSCQSMPKLKYLQNTVAMLATVKQMGRTAILADIDTINGALRTQGVYVPTENTAAWKKSIQRVKQVSFRTDDKGCQLYELRGRQRR
jgi:uncharacterized pyridoxamine 5'-phosphate oxidase family protein